MVGLCCAGPCGLEQHRSHTQPTTDSVDAEPPPVEDCESEGDEDQDDLEDCDDGIELGGDPVNTGDWTSITGN